MKKLSKIVLSCLILLCTYSYAQKITGRVTGNYNVPINDVYVYIAKTNEYTHTNTKGEFILENIQKGTILELSHINFQKKQFIVIDLAKELAIRLEDRVLSLDEIVISKRLNALKLFSNINLQLNPVVTSQDILKTVPGLIIGQHAGGGKAEQIFLRGFDIDHGTDVRLSVEGMPVNLVSHAHGQGYSDLHFVIPETIEKIDFDKGPYTASKGNFATAGYVNFKLKEKLNKSQVKFGVGNLNTQRLSALFNLYSKERTNAYIAGEYSMMDGPYNSPQNFHRINMMGRFTTHFDNGDKVGLLASYLSSEWDASGQIPMRALSDIGWFGAIDDEEGGKTSRTNFIIDYTKSINENAFIKNKVFYSLYDFELYSNFTFFLENNSGDQFKQKEKRELFGAKSEYNRVFNSSDDYRINLQVGVEMRNDKTTDSELTWTKHRKNNPAISNPFRKKGDINETNIGGYVNAEFNFGKWIINPGIRIDGFKFNYKDKLLVDDYKTQAENEFVVSPKLNFIYNYSNDLQVFLKTGKGFHSNDTRSNIDSAFRKDNNINAILPSAYGSDLGCIWKPMPKFVFTTAFWYLYLEEEIAYIGDGGEAEVSGETVRKGIDFSTIYNPTTWLSFNLNANYADPRAVKEVEGKNYIPLAPIFTLQGGTAIHLSNGVFGAIKVLHLNDRPANEDNSIIAEGYTITDMNIGYNWKNFTFGVQVRNIFDVKWKETQFATETKLKGELNPVEEIHFTPGLPFNYEFTVTYKF